MKISIIHPSRSRPEMAVKTAYKWISKADGKIEYTLCIDHDDPLKNEYPKLFPNTAGVHILLGTNKSAIEAINLGAKFSEGDLLIVVSDDFDCHEHWDTLLLQALEGKEDFCVKTNDGAQNFIITLPIMDRKYYERFGYIYNPAYHHMFCDTEMSCVAWMLDKYLEVPITFKHNHYTTGGMQKDAINAKNDATWEQGKEVFRRRYYEYFGITPVKPLPDHSGIVKYMQTI